MSVVIEKGLSEVNKNVRAIQQEPKQTRTYYKVSRKGSMQVAVESCPLDIDPLTGWWKELARLTPNERKTVRADVYALRHPEEQEKLEAESAIPNNNNG